MIRKLLFAAWSSLLIASPALAQFDGGPGSRPRTGIVRVKGLVPADLLVETHWFTGAESSYTFAVPQTGTELELRFFGRGSASGIDCVTFTVNGNNGAIYSIQRQYAQNATASADQDLIQMTWGRTSATSTWVCAPGSNYAAGMSASGEITIHGYTSTGLFKSVTAIGRHPGATTNSDNGYVLTATGTIDTTAPITTLTISGNAAFAVGSYVALYVRL